MKGERGGFFVVVSVGYCFAQAFPFDAPSLLHKMLQAGRAARRSTGGMNSAPSPLPAGEGLHSQGHFSTSTTWAQLKPKLVLTSCTSQGASRLLHLTLAPQSSILQDHRHTDTPIALAMPARSLRYPLKTMQAKSCLRGISPWHWHTGSPMQKAPGLGCCSELIGTRSILQGPLPQDFYSGK